MLALLSFITAFTLSVTQITFLGSLCPEQPLMFMCRSTGVITWALNNTAIFIYDTNDNEPQISASGDVSARIISNSGGVRTSLILFSVLPSPSLTINCNNFSYEIVTPGM